MSAKDYTGGCPAMIELLKELEKKKVKKYVDKDFPANETSIGFDVDDDVVWLRADEFNESEPQLFSDGISPNDIRQGSLGDCYFLSSLSVLAEKPERIEKLFCHHIENKFGVYCVTMYCGGIMTDVIVDDYFLCFEDDKRPVFSHSDGPELWVLLVEKAYAKIHGSYYNIESGTASTALSELTGGPAIARNSPGKDPDEVWKELTLHNRLDHAICSGACEGAEMKDLFGIVGDHAYSVTDLKDYLGNRLIRLRNPWGKTEWNGKWGDKDTKSWTPAAKRALHYEDADDGNFWMPFEEWKLFFSDYVILVLEEGWIFSSFTFKVSSEKTFFSVTTTEPTEFYLTSHIASSEIGIRMCLLYSQYPYFPLGGTTSIFKSTNALSTTRIRVPPGKYLLMYNIYDDDVPEEPMTVTLSSYASNDGVVISDKLDEELTAASKVAVFLIPEYEAEYGTCDTCWTTLGPGALAARDNSYHDYCWKCYYCGVDLPDSISIVDDHIACRDCADGNKKVDEPFAWKLRDRLKLEREEFERASRPKMPSIVAEHHECEAEQAKAKITAADILKICKEQKNSAKARRKKVTDAEIRRAFSTADVSSSGSIEGDEIGDLMIVLGIPLSVVPKIKDIQMKYILDELDKDSSGQVSYKEFSSWMKHTDTELYSERLTYIEQCAVYFLQFVDEDSDEIDGTKMKSLYEDLVNAKLTSVSFEKFLKEIDKDKSETVSFAEFIQWIDKRGTSFKKWSLRK